MTNIHPRQPKLNRFNQLNKKTMKQNKKKTAFLPCKIFKHYGATLTVGVSETTINDKPAPSEVYFFVEGYGNGEDDPEAVATFTPDRAVEIAEALLKFARLAKE